MNLRWMTVLLILGSFGCKHEPEMIPFKPDFLSYKYAAHVNVNGDDILKYIKAYKYHSRLNLDMNSTDSYYNYYYPVDISINRQISGTYRLQSIGVTDSMSFVSYNKLCCYTNPDESYWDYVTDDTDSLNNYIRIHLDSNQYTF